jgi:penicillin-binding protein 1A
MTSEESYGWVKEADLQRDFDQRRLLETNAIFQPGDVIRVRVDKVDAANQAHLLALQQDPLVQGALIAMEASSGHMLAMIGGYDYVASQFNRATQALRQPGSAFKPIIYAAALEAGKTPASIVYDQAIVKEDVNEQKMWKPQNYSQKYYGATTLRQGLTHSRNMVTIKLMEQIGVPAVLGAARRLGIQSPLAPYLSLALGSSGVSLLELTASYNTFANAGLYVSPIFITRVMDAHQNVLEEHLPQAERAVSPEIAYVMTSLLEGVVQNGTGRRVRALGRPVAGKTGTTDDFRDAWFFGYTPELVTGVWVGIDDRSVLGHRESGGRVAAPIWLEFMQEAMRDQPITNFPIPPQVGFYRIDSESGRQATADTEADTHFEAFVRGTQPEVAIEPTHDLRRNIHRLDRRNRSAARAFDGTERIR